MRKGNENIKSKKKNKKNEKTLYDPNRNKGRNLLSVVCKLKSKLKNCVFYETLAKIVSCS